MFGELLSQPSRLAPSAAVDATVGQLVANGLATSATLLCASLLRSASKYEAPTQAPCRNTSASSDRTMRLHASWAVATCGKVGGCRAAHANRFSLCPGAGRCCVGA